MKKAIIAVSTLVIVGLAVAYFSSVRRLPDLEATVHPFFNEYRIFRVKNVGKDQMKILNVLLNDREDCSTAAFSSNLNKEAARRLFVFGLSQTSNDPATERVLRIGESADFLLSCTGSIVRASIWTDHGAATYTFNRSR